MSADDIVCHLAFVDEAGKTTSHRVSSLEKKLDETRRSIIQSVHQNERRLLSRIASLEERLDDLEFNQEVMVDTGNRNMRSIHACLGSRPKLDTLVFVADEEAEEKAAARKRLVQPTPPISPQLPPDSLPDMPALLLPSLAPPSSSDQVTPELLPRTMSTLFLAIQQSTNTPRPLPTNNAAMGLIVYDTDDEEELPARPPVAPKRPRARSRTRPRHAKKPRWFCATCNIPCEDCSHCY